MSGIRPGIPADQREEASMKMKSEATFSRRRLALGFATILAFPAVPAFAEGKRPTGEPAEFLSSIYQHYLGKSSAAATGIPLTDAQSLRGYFTAGLALLILEDRAEATERGGSPVLEIDPFIGRPEWDISDLSIDVKDRGAPKTVGTVTFMNFGKPEKVVLELLRSGKEWRIADVEWDPGTLRGLYRRKAAYDGEAVR
jgi:Protein of unknown function (DUF3828)